ncbi:hypothetical protein BH09BAC3_BH09BAC3_19110 [soil metagenome]
MKKFLCLVLLLISMDAMASTLPTGFVEQLLAQNLDPTDLVLAPDGRIFITIKSGKILIVEHGELSPSIFLDISVDNFNERGLGHMVLDPAFDSNHYYYVYYTVKDANHNRVSRFTANGNSTLPGSEVILLELDVLSGTIHNAGDMAFGLDGKLYVTTGDGSNSANAQSKSVLLGKVLRINSDGTIPSDNPFSADGSVTGKNKAIWAMGFRNPFSIDIQPGTGKIFVSDVGESTWEEINYVQAGKNYGWPLIEGVRTTQTPPINYLDPVYAYQHGNGDFQGCAIVGAVFYNPTVTQFPAQYVGKFFFGDYCNGYIHYIDPVTGVVQPFASGVSRPVAMIIGDDGAMYYLARSGLGGGSQQDNTSSNNGTLWKVTYTGSGIPTISAQPQNTLAAVGDDVTFIVGASGAQPLSYQWEINQLPVSGATNSSFTFTNTQLSDNGKKFRCVITNSFGSVTSIEALLNVTTNTRPVPQIVITLPGNATLYQAGQTIQFSGSATDSEDGVIGAAALTWKIDFHHNEHIHPGLQPTSGITSGTYSVPRVGETSDNVWYRVILTAVDSQGLSATVFQDVFPQKVIITLATLPSGLTLNLDGQPLSTPKNVTSVVGVTRSLEAPATISGPTTLYTFTGWSNPGLNRTFVFDTPASNVEFTASYTPVPVGNGNGLAGSYFNKTATTAQPQPFVGLPRLDRIDNQVDFDWGGGSPDPVINADNFTARWTGEVLPQFTEVYTFYTTSDDGARLWVNNALIIDKWILQAATDWSGTIALTAGMKYPIRLEYFDLGGEAVMKLKWGSSNLPKQTIAKSQLFASFITGLEDNPAAMVPILFPSPADNEITLRSSHVSTTESDFRIIDLFGRTSVQGTFSSGQKEWSISISALPSGYYIMMVNGLALPFVKK